MLPPMGARLAAIRTVPRPRCFARASTTQLPDSHILQMRVITMRYARQFVANRAAFLARQYSQGPPRTPLLIGRISDYSANQQDVCIP